MTLKQVEPVECQDLDAEVDDGGLTISLYCYEQIVCLNETEARALLEWLKRVCE